ncbi:response regulator transcription factor [Photobacterium jeanii]|nr:helix-turn-helix transcriptional regulator [Photobacterium jeanii]PST89414.1 LuxR family transcriptional regulator [Photobacterium jeanii]
MTKTDGKTWIEALTSAIAAVNQPNFASSLVELIRLLVDFDCAVILGYSAKRRPVYLFDELPIQRELLFQYYLNRAYLDDPFYRMLQDDERTMQGVFDLASLAKDLGLNPDYLNDFYQATGWQEELGLVISIEQNRWVVINLGFIANKSQPVSFKKKAMLNQLTEVFELIAALCRQHWGTKPFVLAEPPLTNQAMQAHVNAALSDFGAAVLTKREHQVVRLILQGFDSKAIAEQLVIGEGTVKNHRKRIYSQLHVASLSELHGLFLNHLLTYSP